jgi:hypothetical protein
MVLNLLNQNTCYSLYDAQKCTKMALLGSAVAELPIKWHLTELPEPSDE